MTISSTAFDDGAPIPGEYSHGGLNTPPPLQFRDVPAQARSLVLIMDDPDAPSGLFTHWLAYNIPPETTDIGDGALTGEPLHFGKNGWGEVGYGGPKPPAREHRYFFRLFALDQKPELPDGLNREEIVTVMKDHVLESAELMGRFAAPSGNRTSPAR